MKRPIVIEFAGLPNSGKTTLLHNLQKLCESNNISTIISQEAAELFPKSIPKGGTEQNFWITLESLQKSLELKYQKNADFIFLDRGFYDRLFWASLYKDKDAVYSNYLTNFLETFNQMYDIRPDYLYIVDVDVDESIRRRMLSNEPITFSKKDFLINYRSEFEKFYKKIDSRFYIDSTNLTEHELANIVFNQIITVW